MAKLGIDFGTTNTVAVIADRGHYPIVLHRVSSAAGDVVEEVFPSVIWHESESGEWSFGLEAERRARRGTVRPGCAHIASLKRLLRGFADGQTARFGDGVTLPLEDVLVRFLGGLRESILRSGLTAPEAPLECVISWPANSNGAQRHVTRRAFQTAGFRVIGSVNEPTASAVEYADRVARGNRTDARRLRSSVAVFDLGGGTFDTSLVTIDGGEFRVVASSGIEALGGDDFDEALLALFLEALGIERESLKPILESALLRHARAEKEGISRDPERGFLELVPLDYGLRVGRRPARPVRVRVERYYEVLRPLVDRAVEEMERVLSGEAARREGLSPEKVDAIYLAGGSSRLPLIPLLLRQAFPRTQVVFSDKPFSSVAMGAAIVAAERAKVSDIIARHFGVIRLRDCGRREFFSPIFRPGTRLPGREDPPLEVEVLYSPQHNIGHLQYLECGRLGQDDLPAGDVRRWSEVLFPYDPRIPLDAPLSLTAVAPAEDLAATSVAERYCCDSDGVITVKLERRADGRGRTFEISRD